MKTHSRLTTVCLVLAVALTGTWFGARGQTSVTPANRAATPQPGALNPLAQKMLSDHSSGRDSAALAGVARQAQQASGPAGLDTTGSLVIRYWNPLRDPSVDTGFNRALSAYYTNLAFGSRHASRAYEFQLFSSALIFGVVLVLVFCGILFAWMQFRHGLRRRDRGALPLPAQPQAAPGASGPPGGPADAQAAPDDVTELELSATGLHLRSSILGVIILAISLAFLYLYLMYVYPISYTH